MLKTILISIAMLIVGALVGVFIYSRIIPFPYAVIDRAAAFQGDQDWFFQNMSDVFPMRTVARGNTYQPLPEALGALDTFSFDYEGETKTLDNLFSDMETSGIVVLHQGQLVYERYARGADAHTRMTTFSVAKSITSTLVGFAVEEGLIDSVDDQLVTYLPALAGTAYDGVTIKQALQMSSGVEFDPDLFERGFTDTIDFLTNSLIVGKERAFDMAIDFPRKAEPGTVFNYNTAETQVLIELVRTVTGKNATEYLEEKVWQKLGMDHDAAWVIDAPRAEGAEFGGVFFNAALRDWARFGLLIEQNGAWNGEQLLPDDWVARATVSDEPHLMPGQVHPSANRGYAWHWWTFDDGTFTASGANGQVIYIDQANDLVVARSSTWEEGWVAEHANLSFATFKAMGEFLNAPIEAVTLGTE